MEESTATKCLLHLMRRTDSILTTRQIAPLRSDKKRGKSLLWPILPEETVTYGDSGDYLTSVTDARGMLRRIHIPAAFKYGWKRALKSTMRWHTMGTTACNRAQCAGWYADIYLWFDRIYGDGDRQPEPQRQSIVRRIRFLGQHWQRRFKQLRTIDWDKWNRDSEQRMKYNDNGDVSTVTYDNGSSQTYIQWGQRSITSTDRTGC
jgi:hypothetical protein